MPKPTSSSKAEWFYSLAKLPQKKRIAVIKRGRIPFLQDLQRIIRFVGRSKSVKVLPHQNKLFKKHRRFLKAIAECKGPKKLKNLVLRKIQGGFLPILAALLPPIISLVTTALPKILG